MKIYLEIHPNKIMRFIKPHEKTQTFTIPDNHMWSEYWVDKITKLTTEGKNWEAIEKITEKLLFRSKHNEIDMALGFFVYTIYFLENPKWEYSTVVLL